MILYYQLRSAFMGLAKKLIVEYRTVVKQGGSRYIAIPLRWFEVNKILPTQYSNPSCRGYFDIRIVNREHEASVYAEISRITKEAKTQKEEVK